MSNKEIDLKKIDLSSNKWTEEPLEEEDFFLDSIHLAVITKKGKLTGTSGKKQPGFFATFIEGPLKGQEFKYGVLSDKTKQWLRENGKKLTNKDTGETLHVVSLPPPDDRNGKEITWLKID